MQFFTLFWVVIALSSTTLTAIRKKKASVPGVTPDPRLKALKLDQQRLIAEIRAKYAAMENPFRKYCMFFLDGNRIVRADERETTMLISELCSVMVPVMDGQLAKLQEVDNLLQAADSVGAISSIYSRLFDSVMDIHTFGYEVKEALPLIFSSCREINRVNVLSIKTKGLREVFSDSMLLQWVEMISRPQLLDSEDGMVANGVDTPAVETAQVSQSATGGEAATVAVKEIDTTQTTTAPAVRARTPFNVYTSDWAAMSDTDSSDDDEEVLETTRAPVVAPRSVHNMPDESLDDQDMVTSTIAPTTSTTATTTPRVNIWQQRMAARAAAVTTTAAPNARTTVAPRTTEPATTTEAGWFRVGNNKSSVAKSSNSKRK